MRKLRLVIALALCLAQAPAGGRQRENSLLWETERARLEAILRTLPSDYEKTTFLRTYSGELIDIGQLDDGTKRLHRSIDLASFDVSDFYHQFKSDSTAAECGITSFFYIKLLQTFGFKAYQYSFGFKEKPYERFIHSVTLVEINYEGARRLIVQDAYLNLTYCDSAGRPFDFYDLLATIKRREYERIAVDSPPLKTRLLVPDPRLYYGQLDDPCKEQLAQALRQDSGRPATKIPITRDFATLMQSPCGHFEADFVEALHRNGHMEPFIYAYTLRASEMVGDADHEAVQQRIDALLR